MKEKKVTKDNWNQPRGFFKSQIKHAHKLIRFKSNQIRQSFCEKLIQNICRQVEIH